MSIETTMTDDHLRSLMRDPRYWRDRDPAVIASVTEGFRCLHGGADTDRIAGPHDWIVTPADRLTAYTEVENAMNGMGGEATVKEIIAATFLYLSKRQNVSSATSTVSEG